MQPPADCVHLLRKQTHKHFFQPLHTMRRIVTYIVAAVLLAGAAAFIFANQFQQTHQAAEKATTKRTSLATQAFQAESFNRLKVAGPFEVVLHIGEKTGYELSVPDKYRDEIEMEVVNGTLKVGPKNDHINWNLGRGEDLRLDVYAPTLEAIGISGACKLTADGAIKHGKLDLDLSGACSINLDIDVQQLGLEGSGASSYTLRGHAGEVKVDVSGASKIRAGELQAEVVHIEASGASNIEVHVTEELHVDASGASNIRHRGHPKSVFIDTSGASNVRSIDS